MYSEWVDVVNVVLVVSFTAFVTLYTVAIHHRDYVDKKECTCMTDLGESRGVNGILMYRMEGFVLTVEILSLAVCLLFIVKYVLLNLNVGNVIKVLADGEAQDDGTANLLEMGQRSAGEEGLSAESNSYTESNLHDYLRKKFTPFERGVSLGLKYTKQVKMWFGIFVGIQAILSWTGFAIVLSQHDLKLEIGTDTCTCTFMNEVLYGAMIVKVALFTGAMLVCGVQLYYYADDGLKHKIQLLMGMARRVPGGTRRKIVERYVKSLRKEPDNSDLTPAEQKVMNARDTDLFFAEIFLVLLRSDM